MYWRMTTKLEKALVIKEYYFKNDYKITNSEGFYGGEWRLYSDEPLDIPNNTPNPDDDEIDLDDYYDWEFYESGPGFSGDIEFDEKMPKELRDEAQEIIENETIEGLQEHGWELEDDRGWFIFGGVKIEKIEDQ